MNYFLGIISIFVGVYVGKQFSNKYTLRKQFYSDFNDFCNRLLNNVKFKMDSLNKVILQFENDRDFKFVITQKIIKKSKDNYRIKYLNCDENAFVFSFCNEIGLTDRDTQLNYLSHVQAIISEKYKQSVIEENKFKTPYVKIGFLFGLIVLVMLI